VDNDALQRARDELFEKAKVGVITGEEADAEAMALGLGSLSRRPGEEAYRPEAETHWTLPMAVAWISYLDLNEVREWSERHHKLRDSSWPQTAGDDPADGAKRRHQSVQQRDRCVRKAAVPTDRPFHHLTESTGAAGFFTGRC
jgi:hypothetical protein